MITRRMLLAHASATTVLSALGRPSFAQNARPLNIVVGFPAGVVTDNIARVVAEELRPAYPGGVIVDNRVGAGGRIAADYVKRASADGNTLLLTPGFVMTIYPHVYRKLGFDPLADFKPVAGVASLDYAITVGSGVPSNIKTLPAFIDWCRSDTTRALYGIPAAGSAPHFIGSLLAKETGVPFRAVPYKGGAQLIQDLIGGQIPAAIDPLSNAIQYHQTGRLRILASTGKQRSPLAPDVPTVVELNMPNLVAREFFGIYVPAQVANTRVQVLQEQILAASANTKDRMTAIQVNQESMNKDDLNAFTRQELARWRGVVQASGFKAEE